MRGDMQNESFTDSLAKLEKIALDHYLSKGYEVPQAQSEKSNWYFTVQIETKYKSKALNIVMFIDDIPNLKNSYFGEKYETTKEMFDKAIEYLKWS